MIIIILLILSATSVLFLLINRAYSKKTKDYEASIDMSIFGIKICLKINEKNAPSNQE